MLWSLLKVLVFVAIIAVLALGAGYLMEMDGGALVTMGGREYALSPLKLVLAVIVLIIALWIVLKLLSLLIATLRFINGDETAISRYFSKNRERKGYQALSEA
jgi:HemY protein